MTLTVAANYGGRWDIMQAVTRMLKDKPQLAGGFAEADLSPYLSLAYAPEPDLFIRTGGEQRISNFLLWQLAYTEMYFTDTLWPDFDAAALDRAIDFLPASANAVSGAPASSCRRARQATLTLRQSGRVPLSGAALRPDA